MRIALVAQHATSMSGDALADTAAAGSALGGGAGQTNDTRLRELSRSLASNGHRVTVYAQRHSATLPDRAEVAPGVTVEYMGKTAGKLGESDLLAHVPAFTQPLHERWRAERPDVVHALRWTSGLASLAAARDLRIPVVQSFDSLGVAER